MHSAIVQLVTQTSDVLRYASSQAPRSRKVTASEKKIDGTNRPYFSIVVNEYSGQDSA